MAAERRRDTRRINDNQVLLLIQRVSALEQMLRNGLLKKIDDIHKIMSDLPCKVHAENMRNIIETTELKLKNIEEKTLLIVSDKIDCYAKSGASKNQWTIGTVISISAVVFAIIFGLPGLLKTISEILKLWMNG